MTAPPEPARFSGALAAEEGGEGPSTSGRGQGAGAVVPAAQPKVVRRVIGQQVGGAGCVARVCSATALLVQRLVSACASAHQRSARLPPARSSAQVPDDILHNQALNDAIAILPANYNFEARWRCGLRLGLGHAAGAGGRAGL